MDFIRIMFQVLACCFFTISFKSILELFWVLKKKLHKEIFKVFFGQVVSPKEYKQCLEIGVNIKHCSNGKCLATRHDQTLFSVRTY